MAELDQRPFPIKKDSTTPQGFPDFIPAWIAELAVTGYKAKFPTLFTTNLITVAQRGGFSISELKEFCQPWLALMATAQQHKAMGEAMAQLLTRHGVVKPNQALTAFQLVEAMGHYAKIDAVGMVTKLMEYMGRIEQARAKLVTAWMPGIKSGRCALCENEWDASEELHEPGCPLEPIRKATPAAHGERRVGERRCDDSVMPANYADLRKADRRVQP